MDDKLNSALMKKAVGYVNEEIVEEYNALEGELQLTKKKVTTKFVPPDVSAIKILCEMNQDTSLEDMSDEELEEERRRLIKCLDESKLTEEA